MDFKKMNSEAEMGHDAKKGANPHNLTVGDIFNFINTIDNNNTDSDYLWDEPDSKEIDAKLLDHENASNKYHQSEAEVQARGINDPVVSQVKERIDAVQRLANIDSISRIMSSVKRINRVMKRTQDRSPELYGRYEERKRMLHKKALEMISKLKDNYLIGKNILDAYIDYKPKNEWDSYIKDLQNKRYYNEKQILDLVEEIKDLARLNDLEKEVEKYSGLKQQFYKELCQIRNAGINDNFIDALEKRVNEISDKANRYDESLNEEYERSLLDVRNYWEAEVHHQKAKIVHKKLMNPLEEMIGTVLEKGEEEVAEIMESVYADATIILNSYVAEKSKQGQNFNINTNKELSKMYQRMKESGKNVNKKLDDQLAFLDLLADLKESNTDNQADKSTSIKMGQQMAAGLKRRFDKTCAQITEKGLQDGFVEGIKQSVDKMTQKALRYDADFQKEVRWNSQFRQLSKCISKELSDPVKTFSLLGAGAQQMTAEKRLNDEWKKVEKCLKSAYENGTEILDKYAAAKQAGQDFDKDIDELVQRLKDAERDMPGIMDTIIAYNGPMKETTNENVRIEESLIESKTEKQIDVFRNKTERKSNHIESPDQQQKGIPENEEPADTEPNPDLT